MFYRSAVRIHGTCKFIIIIIIIIIANNNFEAHNGRTLGILNRDLKFRVAAMFVVVDIQPVNTHVRLRSRLYQWHVSHVTPLVETVDQ